MTEPTSNASAASSVGAMEIARASKRLIATSLVLFLFATPFISCVGAFFLVAIFGSTLRGLIKQQLGDQAMGLPLSTKAPTAVLMGCLVFGSLGAIIWPPWSALAFPLALLLGCPFACMIVIASDPRSHTQRTDLLAMGYELMSRLPRLPYLGLSLLPAAAITLFTGEEPSWPKVALSAVVMALFFTLSSVWLVRDYLRHRDTLHTSKEGAPLLRASALTTCGWINAAALVALLLSVALFSTKPARVGESEEPLPETCQAPQQTATFGHGVNVKAEFGDLTVSTADGGGAGEVPTACEVDSFQVCPQPDEHFELALLNRYDMPCGRLSLSSSGVRLDDSLSDRIQGLLTRASLLFALVLAAFFGVILNYRAALRLRACLGAPPIALSFPGRRRACVVGEVRLEREGDPMLLVDELDTQHLSDETFWARVLDFNAEDCKIMGSQDRVCVWRSSEMRGIALRERMDDGSWVPRALPALAFGTFEVKEAGFRTQAAIEWPKDAGFFSGPERALGAHFAARVTLWTLVTTAAFAGLSFLCLGLAILA